MLFSRATQLHTVAWQRDGTFTELSLAATPHAVVRGRLSGATSARTHSALMKADVPPMLTGEQIAAFAETSLEARMLARACPPSHTRTQTCARTHRHARAHTQVGFDLALSNRRLRIEGKTVSFDSRSTAILQHDITENTGIWVVEFVNRGVCV